RKSMVFASLRRLHAWYFQAPGYRRRSRKARTSSKSRLGRKLAFEVLEDRTLLSALLWTDKPGYAPGETAVLTGTDFQVGETVNLHVVRGDNTTYAPWSITDGGAGDLDGVANGSITTSWTLPSDAAGTTFQATATGESSGASAQAAFNGLTTWVFAN